MLAALILFFIPLFALSEDFCIEEVQNPYPESYINYVYRKSVERALLESGHGISCKEDAKRVKARVELLKETPIAYTPTQRVSAYNMELRLSLSVGGENKTFSVIVPYSQPEGGLGDLPRRQAIEDAFRIIYLDILEFIKRR
ncbi:MAG: hypothetical protein ACK4LT_04680 [Aquificaceae bacterium]